VQEAQLTLFDMVQRVKTAAIGADGTLGAFVSYVKGRQVAAGTASEEELEDELSVMDANFAGLSAQKVQTVQQAVELQDTDAAMKSQIRDFSLDYSLAAKRQKATA
jgi:hypothetical protein